MLVTRPDHQLWALNKEGDLFVTESLPFSRGHSLLIQVVNPTSAGVFLQHGVNANDTLEKLDIR